MKTAPTSWLTGTLIPWLGPGGLFLACFLDSSFLSLPEVSDILVITTSAARPERAWVPVLLATLGSLVGSLALWAMARRGGENMLVKRFGAERVARSRAAFARFHLLTLAVPAMLPPPMPFKIFVLSAGAFGVSLRRFCVTLTLARGLRYTFWAILGIAYGDRALAWLQQLEAWLRGNWAALLSLSLLLISAAFLYYALLLRRRDAAVPEA